MAVCTWRHREHDGSVRSATGNMKVVCTWRPWEHVRYMYVAPPGTRWLSVRGASVNMMAVCIRDTPGNIVIAIPDPPNGLQESLLPSSCRSLICPAS